MSSLKIWCEHTSHKEEQVVLFKDFGVTFRVNDNGIIILKQAIDDGLHRDAIVDNICHLYEVTRKVAQKDISLFLEKINNGLSRPSIDQIFPINYEFNITEKCNLRCKHCFIGEYTDQHIDKNLLFDSIGLAIEYGAKRIRIIGGEPFCHPEIEDILEFLAGKKVEKIISTNGTLVTNHHIDIIKNNKFSLGVSIDGVGHVHDQIRGNGSFDKTINCIRMAKDADVNVSAICTMSSVNKSNYRDIIDFCNNNKIHIGFSLLVNSRNCDKNLCVNSEELFPILVDIFLESKKSQYVIGIVNNGYHSLMENNTIINECDSCLSSLSISQHSKVIPCPFLWKEDYFDEKKLMMFDRFFIENFRTNPVYQEFRKNLIFGCQARNWVDNDDPTKHDKISPHELRNYLKKNKICMTTR